MFCSTVIPTIDRVSLNRAVTSVLAQEFTDDDFEVIVVNDSGQILSEADWWASDKVRIINTNRRERSVARNTGAAIARGRFLHFLDDDDWLFPMAFRHLWELSQESDAPWLYGITQLVDRDDRPLIKLHHQLHGNVFANVMAGEWIPLQSSLIRSSDFFRVGGFNTLLAGPEDIDLLRRIASSGDVAETANLIANLEIGDGGTTTDYQAHPTASRWAREKIIDKPGTFARLQASAHSTAMHGRITRIYLTSLLWNLRRGRLLTVMDRGVGGAMSMFCANAGLLKSSYWKSVLTEYSSPTFRSGFDEQAHASVESSRSTSPQAPSNLIENGSE